MPLDFPNSPTNGDLYSVGTKTWQFDGTAWNLVQGSALIGNGAITEEKLASGAVTSAKIADGTIVNADVNASAAIALSKLASGTSGQIIIADGSGVPTYQTPTYASTGKAIAMAIVFGG